MNRNMFVVLRVLAEYGKGESDSKRGHYEFTSSELREFTGLPEEELNDAVKLLKNKSLVVTQGKNTNPITFNTVSLTPERVRTNILDAGFDSEQRCKTHDRIHAIALEVKHCMQTHLSPSPNHQCLPWS